MILELNSLYYVMYWTQGSFCSVVYSVPSPRGALVGLALQTNKVPSSLVDDFMATVLCLLALLILFEQLLTRKELSVEIFILGEEIITENRKT